MSGWSGAGAAALMLALTGCGGSDGAIRITGSSTVHPFTQAVSEAFAAQQAGRTAPAVDSIGTGQGIAAFCAGGGDDTPDIADASRRITRAEFDACQRNGAGPIMEVSIGRDGVALAEAAAGPHLTLSRKDIYLALAAMPMGHPNTARTWRDVDPRLPALPIKVLGPSATSGTHDQLLQLLIEPGCVQANPAAQAMMAQTDQSAFNQLCRAVRTDGVYVVGGEDYAATAQAVGRDAQAIGVFGYSYLESAHQLQGLAIDGVAPDQGTIANGTYPGGRTLMLYVKIAHLKNKPDLQAFLNLYATMWNPGGPLTRRGLIAMSDSARQAAQTAIANGEALDREALF
ncbi:substrate-binding domain-containing protein [Sphingomonas sp.]|uniref:substrate-binding domain-containing protein n=1 Tax=Sphingomonas sp. TaxID=28214 RepID=UPI003CC67098